MNNNGINLNSNKLLKPSKPPKFHGDRRTNAEVWLLELENYFTITRANNDSERISFAVSQFRDLAVVWWKHTLQQNNQQEQPDLQLVTNWDKFKKTLLATYQPVEATETARAALYRLKQTGAVAAYCDMFLRHLNNVNDMNVADQIFLFKQGLQHYIAKDVKHPKTLAEAISYAQRADIEGRAYRTMDSRSRNNYHRPASGMPNRFNTNQVYNYNKYNTGGNGIRTSNTAVPMELGNINSNYDENEMYYNDDYDEHVDYPADAASLQEEIQTNHPHKVNAINNNATLFPTRYQNTNSFRVPGLSREQFQLNNINTNLRLCI